MMFVQYPDLLRRLVAALLGIKYEDIKQFQITNVEIPPETVGSKFCKLDLHMIVNNEHINIELQVKNEGDFPERSLFQWARAYSTSLPEGENYSKLPRTIIIGIVYFKLFECEEFHSEYQLREVTRNTQLTDKIGFHFFEMTKLPKLPKKVEANKWAELWLSLFKAQTKEELDKIEALGGPVMKEAVNAYWHVSAMEEFLELERMRSKARHDEAQALKNADERADRRATKREYKKWKNVLASKDAELVEWKNVVADKDVALADKDAEIARLNEQLKKIT